jgi:hypothetical protein
MSDNWTPKTLGLHVHPAFGTERLIMLEELGVVSEEKIERAEVERLFDLLQQTVVPAPSWRRWQ